MLTTLNQLLQVHIALAQNQVDLIILQVFEWSRFVAHNIARWNDTEKAIAAWMGHLFQNCHLTQQSSRPLRITIYVLVALTCVLSLRFHVQDLHHLSIRALSQLLN